MFVWTINNPGEMVQFRDLGVNGIISDKTDLLYRVSRNPDEAQKR